MSFAFVYSRAIIGVSGHLIKIETHLSSGLPQFHIVGLPEKSLRESKERVRSAIINANFRFPMMRITVNLAPAELPKQGSQFDLAIAVSILMASDQLQKRDLSQFEFAGELTLSGELRSVRVILPFALATKQAKRQLIFPSHDHAQVNLIDNVTLLPAKHLLDVCHHINGKKILEVEAPVDGAYKKVQYPDFSDVQGQQEAKRALTIAAAGQHNILMLGPPGTGKTLLASRLPSIMPDLTQQETLEVACLQAICPMTQCRTARHRPFQSPHHTASHVALVGGGNPPGPGEISLSHHGILFLDELPEFSRAAIEALREPLESKKISLSRANHHVVFPANFLMVAAMNPCPCGFLTHSQQQCQCTPPQIQRYLAKLSGPLLDRIDLHIHIRDMPNKILFQSESKPTLTSASLKKQVDNARALQVQRQSNLNGLLKAKNLQSMLNKKLANELIRQTETLNLSPRNIHKIIKVARTIADLDASEAIQQHHLLEAIHYRSAFLNLKKLL